MSDNRTRLVSFETQECRADKQTENLQAEHKNGGKRLTIVEPRKSSSEGNSSEDEFGKFEQSDRESADLSLEIVREQRRRRKTIVSSFRLAELVPTSNTPFTNYRRKSTSVLNAELVVDYKANEQ